MAAENLTATSRSELPLVDGKSITTRAGINLFESTVEVTAAAEALSTYWMARLPMNARISHHSGVAWDDLASAGAPTLDFGLFAVGSNFTDDAVALSNGLDAATASTFSRLVLDAADVGKYVWELAGEATNPGGYADIKVSLVDAAANDGGTLTMTLVYAMP